MAALALLAGQLAGEGPRYTDGLRATAAALGEWLPATEPSLRSLAARLAPVERMLVLGRGPEFATARELALKLLEICRVAAEPLTATDLAHGPVAALDSMFPVWAIADDDATLPTVIEAVLRARAAGATVITSGPAADAVEGASISVPVPPPPLPLLAPLLSIVPGQLFAWALALQKGLDPDHPTGLLKVTLVP
jgi:glucosamine--fructose-6-phosphate aminotransferase (isomerizing)